VTPLKNKGMVRVSLDLKYVQVQWLESIKVCKLFPYMMEWEFEESEGLVRFINNIEFI
jgi:hypothetical protein